MLKGPVLAIMVHNPQFLFNLVFMGVESIVYMFYSSGQQKLQNFQHLNNHRQEIAACNV